MRSLLLLLGLVAVGLFALPHVSGSAATDYAFDVRPWRGDPTGINVVTLKPSSAYRPVVVLARNAVRGGTETTSSMCARARCLAAVNGDFFVRGEPIGGIASNCKLLHTPLIPHEQAYLGSQRVSHGLSWAASVTTTAGKNFSVSGINRTDVPRGLVLYTGEHRAATRLGDDVTDYVFRPQPWAAGINRTARLTVDNVYRGGGRSFPAGTPVVSAHGTTLPITAGSSLVLRISAPSGSCEMVGGHPILVKDGTVLRSDPNDKMLHMRLPRTAIGWRSDGTMMLATFNSPGATTAEVASYLRRDGVVQALNLDGGGSSTFVAGGRVRNRPSDGRERAVVSAVVIQRTS